MSGGRRPTRDRPTGADLRDAILGGGGIGLLVKLALSFVPDSVPQKQTLDELVPWFSAVTGAGISWAWARYHSRAAENDEEEAVLAAEEYFQKLLLDPAIPSDKRQEAREMLADLRMLRASSLYDEAVTLLEERKERDRAEEKARSRR